MSVRRARVEEADLLSDLHHAVFETSVWEGAFWRDSIEDPGCVVMLAETEAVPGGLCAARQILDEAEILTIGVLPKARRQGHARALLSQTLGVLDDSGATRIFLEVAETNEAAIALYSAAGFAKVGARKDYYGTGRSALLMERRRDLPATGDGG